MAGKKKEDRPSANDAGTEQQELGTSTPLWDRYYRAMRKQVRFPRYYKKALNW